MPCIEDWLTNPLCVAEGVLREGGKPEHKEVSDFFARRLQEPEALQKVPSLNDVPGHLLKPNSLVRFRCMVQDMFDPEFYLALYETVDKANGSSQLHCGMYQDVLECPVGFKLNLESTRNVTRERYTFYCVPIPGETRWAKDTFSRRSAVPTNESEAAEKNFSGFKRRLGEEEMDEDTGYFETGSEMGVSNSDYFETKKCRPESTASDSFTLSSKLHPDLNFPLPNEAGPACIVHVYDLLSTLKLNDMVEFIGVLSVDPGLASFGQQSMSQDKDQQQSAVLPLEGLYTVEEHAVHHPPPSLVPRIHCLVFHRLVHSNPCVSPAIKEGSCSEILGQFSEVRGELLSKLIKVMYGDLLAGEYLLLHLISSVYNWSDILPVGKFSLNLSGSLPSQPFTHEVYKLVEQLVPKCYFLPLSLENMNTIDFVPKKDYTANRLKSSILQLSEGTNLVIDETALANGQLNENGIKNLTALGNIISWQKLEYDFYFYKTEFMTNLPLLILSEGKSLLPADCHIVLKHDKPAESANSLLSRVPPATMDRMREYLGVARLAQYSLSHDMQQTLQDDFVKSRQQDHTNMTAEDFHLLLLLARLMSLSLGMTTLTQETWSQVKKMEMERRARLA